MTFSWYVLDALFQMWSKLLCFTSTGCMVCKHSDEAAHRFKRGVIQNCTTALPWARHENKQEAV